MLEFASVLGSVESDFRTWSDSEWRNAVAFPFLRRSSAETAAPAEEARIRMARNYYRADESSAPHTEEPGELRDRARERIRAVEAVLAQLEHPGLTTAKLKALRREFAWRFHPDRVSASSRDDACQLMAQLNARIDALIARRARGSESRSRPR